jgi:ferredoxin
MVVKIDEETCIGCGVCASMLDSVYEMDDDNGVATVKDATGGTEEEIQETIDACPVACITQ